MAIQVSKWDQAETTTRVKLILSQDVKYEMQILRPQERNSILQRAKKCDYRDVAQKRVIGE